MPTNQTGVQNLSGPLHGTWASNARAPAVMVIADYSASNTPSVTRTSTVIDMTEELIERRCKRLEELSDAITSKDGWESVHREFTMRIPADEDRDADLVLYWAAKALREQQAEIERQKAHISELREYIRGLCNEQA